MSRTGAQILVVVQQALLAGAISRAMADQGYTAHWAASGQSARDMADQHAYDAFMVEAVLPDMRGADLVAALRAWNRRAKVLVLGGGGASEDSAGKNDPSLAFLAKPFTVDDLIKRVQSLLSANAQPPEMKASPRPSAGSQRSQRLVYHRLEADPTTRAVSRDGRPVMLTEREFAVLDCLMRSPEVVVSKAELAEAVWGAQQNARSNVLEVYINFLRRKIDQGFDRKLLHTVRGAGYVLRTD